MKRFMATVAMLALSTGIMVAQDGATLFKKCARCHGANGEGKLAPAIAGKDVADVLMHGGKRIPHARRFAGLTDDQIARVAVYVKNLKCFCRLPSIEKETTAVSNRSNLPDGQHFHPSSQSATSVNTSSIFFVLILARKGQRHT